MKDKEDNETNVPKKSTIVIHFVDVFFQIGAHLRELDCSVFLLRLFYQFSREILFIPSNFQSPTLFTPGNFVIININSGIHPLIMLIKKVYHHTKNKWFSESTITALCTIYVNPRCISLIGGKSPSRSEHSNGKTATIGTFLKDRMIILHNKGTYYLFEILKHLFMTKSLMLRKSILAIRATWALLFLCCLP